ncbi:hypothetical protein QUB08_13335, partial [Microcoleus sp. BR0-C5]|uniref:hypothetical protein n=1 Tax=Microcoleus sp. BR0-C5 TaxID=2818713 RepID=UPI002FD7451E
VRRGLKSPSHSRSRLKPTETLNSILSHLQIQFSTLLSPLSEDLRYETGNSFPVGLWDSTILIALDFGNFGIVYWVLEFTRSPRSESIPRLIAEVGFNRLKH